MQVEDLVKTVSDKCMKDVVSRLVEEFFRNTYARNRNDLQIQFTDVIREIINEDPEVKAAIKKRLIDLINGK